MKRIILLAALLAPLTAGAWVRCPSIHDTNDSQFIGKENDKGQIVLCNAWKGTPCYTPEQFYEKCKYTHKAFLDDNKAFKKAIEDEVSTKRALIDRHKRIDADIAQMEQAAKNAQEQRRKEEEEKKNLLDQSLEKTKDALSSFKKLF